MHELLADFGYTFCKDTLIKRGVRGFTVDHVVPYKFSDVVDAVNYLIPRIRINEFVTRAQK